MVDGCPMNTSLWHNKYSHSSSQKLVACSHHYLAQTNGFLPVMGCERSIQIHNINGNHWVTSYIGYDGELYMYDSSFSPEEGELSSSLTHQLAKIYKGLISKVEDDEGVEESRLFINLPPVQQQKGFSDCGVLHSTLH